MGCIACCSSGDCTTNGHRGCNVSNDATPVVSSQNCKDDYHLKDANTCIACTDSTNKNTSGA